MERFLQKHFFKIVLMFLFSYFCIMLSTLISVPKEFRQGFYPALETYEQSFQEDSMRILRQTKTIESNKIRINLLSEYLAYKTQEEL